MSGKWATLLIIILMFVAGFTFIVMSEFVDNTRDDIALCGVGFTLIIAASWLICKWHDIEYPRDQ